MRTDTGADTGAGPSPSEQLGQLLPPAPPLDTATVGTGLGDAAARLSVARLLARETGPTGPTGPT